MTEVGPKPTKKLAIFTIVSNNYLHFARTLMQSVAAHHPDAHLFCVIVDSDMAPATKCADDFTVIGLEELDIPDLQAFVFQYTVLELNTAVKPWAIEALLDRGYEEVIYIDPDIRLYRPLNEILETFSQGGDIVITPHLLAPVQDDRKPSELDIRRAGTYNFGFCAVRQSTNTREFLTWWQGKLFRDCVVDIDRGVFVDQSWIDLVPGMFENVRILRHPGYNVAYWNVAQRSVVHAPDGTWTVNGEPLVFFHFSGFNPFKPDKFSKHQNRFTLTTLGPSSQLVKDYASALFENGAREYSKLPYGFAVFSDGTRIPDYFRRIYLKNDQLRQKIGNDPFSHPESLTWTVEGAEASGSLPITWAMHGVFLGRPDLQREFDLSDPSGAKRYWHWFLAEGTTYLSDAGFSRHKQLWADQIDQVDSVAMQCHQVFSHMLGRSPRPNELRRLRRYFASRLGTTVAVFAIASSAESRARGKTRRRIKNTLRSIRRTRRMSAIPAATGAEPGHLAKPSANPYSGIYPPDGDSADMGVWCGASVSLPLGNRKIQTLRIEGTVPTELHRRASRVSNVRLHLRLDGQAWTSITLPKDGRISIAMDVPEHFAKARSLQIDADSAFVPEAIGIGADRREISWRLKKLSVGGADIFDSARPEPMMDLSDLYQVEGFNLIGYVFAELGVGEGARAMALAAEAASISYSIVDVGYQTPNRQTDRRAEANAVEADFGIDMVYVNADQTKNTLQYLESKGHKRPDYRIGYWHWEQPRLPDVYMESFDGLDEVWVPTAFVQEAVSSISPVPVFKVPHAVEFNVDSGWTRERFGIPARKFAVLVMYDFHSYRFRKNPEAAISAFKRAARGRTDMCLVIKTINAAQYPEDYAALKNEVASLDSVKFIDEFYSREQLYSLEACCDCMLSLHRAEGFGLGPAEMMYLGKPVIATGWSGNMEFMTPMNSFPVNYELRPLESQVGVYVAGLDWAEPDIDHAENCLRRIIDDPSIARDIGKRAQHTMHTKFSPQAIGQQYKERFALIGMRQ